MGEVRLRGGGSRGETALPDDAERARGDAGDEGAAYEHGDRLQVIRNVMESDQEEHRRDGREAPTACRMWGTGAGTATGRRGSSLLTSNHHARLEISLSHPDRKAKGCWCRLSPSRRCSPDGGPPNPPCTRLPSDRRTTE